MKLHQLAAKPQLVKIQLDDEKILEKYGEPVEFWIYDRIDIETFSKLASVNQDNFGDIAHLAVALIRDDTGQPAIPEGQTLPGDLLFPAITAVVESLGKSVSAPGTKEILT